MNLFLLNVLCVTTRHPLIQNKIHIQMLNKKETIVEIFTDSVKAVVKKPFFSNFIFPASVVVAPQCVFIHTFRKAILFYPVQANTIQFVLGVLLALYYIYLLQVEFLKRYLLWLYKNRY